MPLVETNRLCCSCTACYHVCPKHAITLEVNKEGFLVPKINKSVCIECSICEKLCPMLHPNIDTFCELESPKVFGAIHLSEDIRAKSQSGGAFTAFSDIVLSENGIIYGCKYNEIFEAVHSRAETIAERNCFRGSKYVQSNMGDILPKVKNDLLSGKKVLFSGTPCQVAGLKNYLHSINTDSLITIDLSCHGVPSPKIYKEYLEYMRKKHHGKNITDVNLRCKDTTAGWHNHIERITIDGIAYDSKEYSTLFYTHTFFAKSCFNCPFRSIHRIGDITIADYWYVQHAMPEFDDNKGTSEILINTHKGDELFSKASISLRYKQTTIENANNGGMKTRTESYNSLYRRIIRISYRLLGNYRFFSVFPLLSGINKLINYAKAAPRYVLKKIH